ncbi:MAG: hypothetical protein GXO43_02280 [Crenarchaeota archaeon]|nr:hypothetical protein [Thermoproteota archaeon]
MIGELVGFDEFVDKVELRAKYGKVTIRAMVENDILDILDVRVKMILSTMIGDRVFYTIVAVHKTMEEMIKELENSGIKVKESAGPYEITTAWSAMFIDKKIDELTNIKPEKVRVRSGFIGDPGWYNLLRGL